MRLKRSLSVLLSALFVLGLLALIPAGPVLADGDTDVVADGSSDTLIIILVAVVLTILIITIVVIPFAVATVREERSAAERPAARPASSPTAAGAKAVPEPEENPSGKIRILTGSMKDMEIPVNDRTTLCLGKDPRVANIVFTNDYIHVSRFHCTVSFDYDLGKYFVTDSSLNGTFKDNGQRLTKGVRTPFPHGTVIMLANNRCKLLLV